MAMDLPVLNYGSTGRDVLVAKIMEIMGDLGFLYLENIPGFNEDELRWCVDFFFGLPLEKRMEIARKKYRSENNNWYAMDIFSGTKAKLLIETHPGCYRPEFMIASHEGKSKHLISQRYRGYFGVNQVGSSFKEGFEMGKDLTPGDPDIQSGFPLTETNLWPWPDSGQDAEPFEKFRKTMEKYYSLFYEVALDLLRMIATGLGLEEHYFDELYVPKTLSTFRLINYPVHDFEIPADAYSNDDGRLLSTAAHRDSATLTLLSTFDYEGLQVEMDGGKWLDVTTRKNALIVNLGETLSKMTGQRVKATMHRVLAIGRPRQSVPFFFEPAYHAMVPKNIPKKGEEERSASEHPLEDSFKYGPWHLEYMKRFVEFQGLDE